ncbi:MAG TPA: hypothetical protein VG325_18185 [Solirubrobacteraceae bacterium]|jgi:hypothetical protein|nr:hypothetical protein [Solirubrobacteraceae bacterium]
MSVELERGDIFFFYRPRVGLSEVRTLDDVQRLFFVLRVGGTCHVRDIIVGTKHLPDPDRHERIWAFVSRVSDDTADIQAELRQRSYQTRTRGERHQPGARPAGEGRYAIVDHGGHSHLAYVLELPRGLSETQRALRIESEASYIVAVRNPDAPAPPGMGSPGRRPELPEHLRDRFRGRRFVQLDTPEWLDHEGLELVMIGAARDPAGELGIDLDPRTEEDHDADLFRTLRIQPSELPH